LIGEACVRDAVDSLGLARTLVDYNEWANERILATSDRVPDEAFHRPLTGAGHGSIFGQLRHVAYVQLGYLAGFEGRATDAASSASVIAASGVDLESRAGIRDAFGRSHKGWRELAAGLTVERWSEPQHRWPGKLPLGIYMLQVLMHSQYHRGETAALLTELGYSPGDIDFLFFAFERPGS
jgi:uncharacterized damage-inducible protein DinB